MSRFADEWRAIAEASREQARRAREDGWVQPPLGPAPEGWDEFIDSLFPEQKAQLSHKERPKP